MGRKYLFSAVGTASIFRSAPVWAQDAAKADIAETVAKTPDAAADAAVDAAQSAVDAVESAAEAAAAEASSKPEPVYKTAADGSACELHVWPTENYIGINTGLLSGFGIVGALADQASHKNRVATVKDLMEDYLDIFFEDNKEVPIIVRTDYKVAAKYADLEQSLIPTADGRLVPFSSVASIELGSSFGSIKRVEGKREIQVSADIEEGVETNRIDEMVSNYWDSQLSAKYQGIEFSAGGDFAEFSSLLFDILRVFLLGIFLIYLILGAQFNSYTQPLLILLSVPFAFIGVILYLFFSGTPFSTTVIYAGVALAGIAVNDAIVLISFVNELRQKGTQVKEAVIEAAKQRIRPILLTSLTTIGGLLPTAIGIGGKSVVWGPMASTIMFGLIFSTLSALFVIPLLFGLLYDRKSKQLKGSAV